MRQSYAFPVIVREPGASSLAERGTNIGAYDHVEGTMGRQELDVCRVAAAAYCCKSRFHGNQRRNRRFLKKAHYFMVGIDICVVEKWKQVESC